MKVIDSKQLPMRSPVLAGIVFWLALDHWNAPGWLYGAIGVFWGLLFLAWIIKSYVDEEVKIQL